MQLGTYLVTACQHHAAALCALKKKARCGGSQHSVGLRAVLVVAVSVCTHRYNPDNCAPIVLEKLAWEDVQELQYKK